ncbi:MAG: bifunctional (p)ppGpp synthetase/guanosine-3',5'-bis(diphosphate) 3'-pyrophosphohydrolase, partial [Clostridia bacterium]|nr:bifunctional (p)ppGpp synthetase/guanosine-3',5'-bis(diphosphate) 3'-pyrophosphohydrolase [Clostridia bacterium]
IRKMLIAMAADIRVIIIKLADRLHNMRTLSAQSTRKQLEKSLETIEIYAPIAHRLGIRAVKEELEDLAISYLDPIAYAEIEEQLEKNREYRDTFIESIKSRIKERMGDSVPNLSIEGRIKSIHGIYRKMYMQNKQFEEIYDVYALRVIVNTVTDCYNVLGLVHEMFRPIPGRFKDYISTPKSNLYQSLHTTVISREGLPFEVQIRTWDMHHTAEYGIAAHWKYKSGISGSDERFEERLAWIRQLLESQNDVEDVGEIVQTIKTDLAPEDVFGVTPKGDVISLPVGSTVIDFAYAIHSAVGNRMVGAKVDGRIVPLDYQIATGDVIEVITTSQADRGPSRDWLKMVKTSEARSKIRAWFKKERRPENIETGKEEVERALRQANIRISEEDYENLIKDLAERYQCSTADDFYAKIGYGGLIFSNIVPSIKDRFRQKPQKDIASMVSDDEESASPDGVVVEGIDNCLVKLSRCCSPLPGDSIIGFITRGHGVSVHKRDCTNVPK